MAGSEKSKRPIPSLFLESFNRSHLPKPSLSSAGSPKSATNASKKSKTPNSPPNRHGEFVNKNATFSPVSHVQSPPLKTGVRSAGLPATLRKPSGWPRLTPLLCRRIKLHADTRKARVLFSPQSLDLPHSSHSRRKRDLESPRSVAWDENYSQQSVWASFQCDRAPADRDAEIWVYLPYDPSIIQLQWNPTTPTAGPPSGNYDSSSALPESKKRLTRKKSNC